MENELSRLKEEIAMKETSIANLKEKVRAKQLTVAGMEYAIQLHQKSYYEELSIISYSEAKTNHLHRSCT